MEIPFKHKPRVGDRFMWDDGSKFHAILQEREVSRVYDKGGLCLYVDHVPANIMERGKEGSWQTIAVTMKEWVMLPDAPTIVPRYVEKQPPALTRESEELMQSIVNSEAFKNAVREEVQRALSSMTTKIEALPQQGHSEPYTLTVGDETAQVSPENLEGWAKKSVFFGAPIECKNFYKDSPPASQAEIDAVDRKVTHIGVDPTDGPDRLALASWQDSKLTAVESTPSSQETPPERTEGDDLMDFFK